MEIIKDRQIVGDTWLPLDAEQPLPESGDLIVPLARWQRDKAQLSAYRGGKLGVRLQSDDEPEALADDLGHFALVAVEFPKFTDGRGFSSGRLLRDRYGFQGELRAVGNVLRDQMFYMHRCGFNAFELSPGKSLQSALQAFNELTVTYQAAADDPRPLFRRRAS